MVSKERMVQLASRVSKVLPATPGSLAQQDKREIVARLVHKVQRVSQDRLASVVVLELMEFLVLLDNQDRSVQLDNRASQVHRVTLVSLVPPVNLARLGHVELPAHQETLANQANLASRDLKERQVLQDSQDRQDHLDRRDSEAKLEPLAIQVGLTLSQYW